MRMSVQQQDKCNQALVWGLGDKVVMRCCNKACLVWLPRALQVRLLVAARISLWQQEKCSQDLLGL